MHLRLLIGFIVFLVLAGATLSLLVPAPSDTQTTFAGVPIHLDYATTETERERGLGGRTDIPSDYGMLFVFPHDDRYGFWMKDTLVPLDMFWLNASGEVVFMATDVAPSTYVSDTDAHVFYPSVPARYVLETAAGFAAAHGVATGTPLRLQKFPTVSE